MDQPSKKQRFSKNKLTVPESKARSTTRVQQAKSRELQRQQREMAQRKAEKTRNKKIMKKTLLPKPTISTIRSDKSLTLVIF